MDWFKKNGLLTGFGLVGALVVGAFLLSNASKQQMQPQTPVDQSSREAQIIVLPADVADHPEFELWFSKWQGITLEEFYLSSSEPIDALYRQTPEEERLNSPITYRYIFSPDRSKFIDYLASFGEPDSSVDIYNRNSDGVLENLRFCGTPCGFDYAFWIDNDRFVIFGRMEATDSDGNQKCDVPEDWDTCYDQLTIDVYDLQKNTVAHYLSGEHILPGNPFVAINNARWLSSLSEEEKKEWQWLSQ